MTALWWLLAAAACIGLFYVIRVRAPRRRNRDQLSPAQSEAFARRADQQLRWAQRGDPRGVYGVDGTELMKRVEPQPDITADLDNTADYPKTAAVANTAADLDTLLAEKLPCWRWATFASVLVQRRAAVQSRLRDDQLGYGAPSGERSDSGFEVGRFAVDRMDELVGLVKQVEDFMLTPAFIGVFGDPGDEGSADAEGIVHTANRLMDYHDRFLGMAERCRGLAVPSEYAGLMHDLAQLLDVPVAAYRTFINDFVERVGEMPRMLHYAHGNTIELDPVVLQMEPDNQPLHRITSQLNEIVSR